MASAAATVADGDQLGAAGVNWLSQASFDPPLIMAAVSATPLLLRSTGNPKTA